MERVKFYTTRKNFLMSRMFKEYLEIKDMDKTDAELLMEVLRKYGFKFKINDQETK